MAPPGAIGGRAALAASRFAHHHVAMDARVEPTIESPRRRGRPKNENLAELDGRIVAVSKDLFFRNGYGPTTTSAVAAAARVSKTTLYSRFPSKQALFGAIVAEQVRSWEFGENRIELDPHESLEEVLNAYGDIAIQAGLTPEFVQIDRLVRSEAARFPELAQAVAERFAIGVAYVADFIRIYAERDGFPCRDPQGSAERFLMTLTGCCSMMALQNRTLGSEERRLWLKDTVRHFIHGRTSW